MIHNSKELKGLSSRQPNVGEPTAVAAINAFCDTGVESVILSKKLFDNTQKMLLSAATHKDAKDVGRTMSAFVNSSYRDIAGNAGAVLEIWRRFFHDALATKASSFAGPQVTETFEAAEAPRRL